MQAQAAVAQTSVATPQGLRLAQASVPKGQPHSTNTTYMNKEVRHLDSTSTPDVYPFCIIISKLADVSNNNTFGVLIRRNSGRHRLQREKSERLQLRRE